MGKCYVFNLPDVKTLIWPLEDLLVVLKRIVVETVENWNSKLVGSTNKKDSEKKKDKPPQSQVVEDTDASETESTAESDLQKSENSFTDFSPTNIIAKKNKSLDHGDCK